MNRWLRALTPESPREADTRAVQGVDRLRGAIEGRHASAARSSKGAQSNVIGPDKPEIRVPTRGDAIEDPRSARPDVTVRISVIDGADRLAYVDVRDGIGWKQPLAIREVASELRHRPSATVGAASHSEPRTVRTVEMVSPLAPPNRVNSMLVPKTPTPYSLGKANVSASASLSRRQERLSVPSRAGAPALPVQATVRAPTRSR